MELATHSELVALQRTLYVSRNATRRWLHCTRYDWIVEAIRQAAEGSRESALEVGPCSGVYLPTLASLHREVTATDIEDEYLRHLAPLVKQYANLNLMEDDITASRLPPVSFDLVLCTEVLEHIVTSQQALLQIYRLLKPGGVLIVSTPQRYSPLELACKIAFLPGVIQLVRLIYREPILETGHVNPMTEGQVQSQLVAARFKIETHHTSGLYLPIIAEFGGDLALRLE
jgi:2-polyprenyl-3-methyl-5-hydroxy-6-metoxy-1,4-benzoquinol methylase